MHLADLKAMARKILDISETDGEFHAVSFTTSSGGSPRNLVGVVEVSRTETFRYDTTANGAAYSGELKVMCRDTGTCDSKKRMIYETQNGTVFVYDYRAGSPASFDSGRLIDPELVVNCKE